MKPWAHCAIQLTVCLNLVIRFPAALLAAQDSRNLDPRLVQNRQERGTAALSKLNSRNLVLSTQTGAVKRRPETGNCSTYCEILRDTFYVRQKRPIGLSLRSILMYFLSFTFIAHSRYIIAPIIIHDKACQKKKNSCKPNGLAMYDPKKKLATNLLVVCRTDYIPSKNPLKLSTERPEDFFNQLNNAT